MNFSFCLIENKQTKITFHSLFHSLFRFSKRETKIPLLLFKSANAKRGFFSFSQTLVLFTTTFLFQKMHLFQNFNNFLFVNISGMLVGDHNFSLKKNLGKLNVETSVYTALPQTSKLNSPSFCARFFHDIQIFIWLLDFVLWPYVLQKNVYLPEKRST